jgi:hypothetical protein
MTSDGDTTDGTTDEPGSREKHSKRAGEPDPGLDPAPYESSTPGPEAVQRSPAEERALDSVGEGTAGDGVEGSEAADEAGEGGDTTWDGDRSRDQVGVELVDQPDQPNMGTPHTAPPPAAPRRDPR